MIDPAAILAHRAYVVAVLEDPRPNETPAPFNEWHSAQTRPNPTHKKA